MLNFSPQELQHRNRGYLIALFFTFAVVDIVVLPLIIYGWTAQLVVLIIAFIVSALLFAMGTSSKHPAVGGIITFVFFTAWTIVGILYVRSYYHLSWQPPTVFFISFIVSLLRLELLRKH